MFNKITAFFDFESLQFPANTLWKVCIINSSYNFKAINLKLRTKVTGILKMRLFLFEEKTNYFNKITAFLDFEILQFLAKRIMENLNIQLFLQF